MLIITRYAVTACETVTIYLFVFVVISKEEGSIYRRMVLGRISTSANSVEMFQYLVFPHRLVTLAVSVIPPLEACILMTGISVALHWHLKEIS